MQVVLYKFVDQIQHLDDSGDDMTDHAQADRRNRFSMSTGNFLTPTFLLFSSVRILSAAIRQVTTAKLNDRYRQLSKDWTAA
jgi:hypothetical protein